MCCQNFGYLVFFFFKCIFWVISLLFFFKKKLLLTRFEPTTSWLRQAPSSVLQHCSSGLSVLSQSSLLQTTFQETNLGWAFFILRQICRKLVQSLISTTVRVNAKDCTNRALSFIVFILHIVLAKDTHSQGRTQVMIHGCDCTCVTKKKKNPLLIIDQKFYFII